MAMIWEDYPTPLDGDGAVLIWTGASPAQLGRFVPSMTGVGSGFFQVGDRAIDPGTVEKVARVVEPEETDVPFHSETMDAVALTSGTVEEVPKNWFDEPADVLEFVEYLIEMSRDQPTLGDQFMGLAYPLVAGLYWFCHDHHEGQGSELYELLSRAPYTPGRLEGGPPDDESAYVYGKLLEASP
jgi:hypothetical protein